MKRIACIPRHLFLLTVLLLAGMNLQAENIRGRIAGTIEGDGVSISFKPEELVVIEADSLPEFQEGLELKLSIPAGLRRYQNSFALMIFRAVDPAPTADERSYRGTRAFMRLLPSRDFIFVRIPLESGHAITGDALTDVLPLPVEAHEFPLIVTVLPVTKGIPDSAFTRMLEISAQALWKDEGTLSVNIGNLSGLPDEEVSITIDGTEVPGSEPISLTAGIHRVRVVSSHAPTVEKNVAIEPGEQAVLDIDLDYRSPEILVNVPEGATLLLDGSPVSVSAGGSPLLIEVEPGEHQVTYRLGDMDVSRIFTISPGGKVNINLIIDIDVVDFSEGTGNPFGAGDG